MLLSISQCCSFEMLVTFKDNLITKLIRDLHLPKGIAQQFILNIIGTPSNLECGLLDAEDEELTVQVY